jgi:hypothetical protein
MDLQTKNKIIGLPNNIIYNKYEPIDELNARINSRQFPSSPLEPNFSPRPVPTQCTTTFPILDHHNNGKEPIIPYPKYNSDAIFNPGNCRAPCSGFKIDLETELRNQNTLLNHGASQSIYVPSSSSDLYNVNIISRPSVQPHPELFTIPQFERNIHPNLSNTNIGNQQFFNHTRTQLRNS